MNYQPSREQSKSAQIKSWKQTFIIDKRLIQSHEKDLPKQFTFSYTIPQSCEIVNKMLKESENKQNLLQKQQKKIFQRLNDLNSGISQLKQTLKHYEHTNEYLVKVQNLSEGILTKVQKIKETMSSEFESLLDAQQALENDLKLYDHKIELIISGQYEVGKRNLENQIDFSNKENKRLQSAAKKSTTNIKPQPNIPKTDKANNQRDREAQLAQDLEKTINKIKKTQGEVQDIEQKINFLGKNLGWNEQDHSDFIKIWNRCQGKNYFEIQDELASYFRLYTEEQIRDHMNKYMKFKQLNEEKKEKILEYKQFKEQKKIKQFEIMTLQQQRQRKIQNKQKNQKISEEEQQMMKQKVEEWKKVKQEKKLRQEQLKRQEEERINEQKMRRAYENMYRKEAVQKWKQQQEEIKTKKLKESRDTKRTVAVIDKQTEQRIRQRQEKLIAEKIQKVMRKKYQEEQKLQKQQRLKQKKFVKYAYVSSKVQEKTTAIKQKQRQKFDGKNKKDANTFGGNLLHAGVRATPAWMQGL